MIALAVAGAICVRRLLSSRAFVGVPFVFSCFSLLDFAGTAINAVTINGGTRLGIADAFSVVDFAENEFKVSVRRLFRAVLDAIP